VGSNRLILLFVICLALPSELAPDIGSIKLPPYRLICLLMFISCIMRVFSTRTKETRGIDTFVILYTAWSVLALLVNHGLAVWQFAGMTALETLGPYFLARALITDSDRFIFWVRCYYKVILIVLPFALYETVTGHHLLKDIARALTGYPPLVGRPERLGLARAFGPFEHPIHYGVFCVLMIGMSSALGRGGFMRVLTVLGAVFCSLSSGPLLGASVQVALKIWDYFTTSIRNRWRLFASLVAVAYVAVDFMSNRTPFHVLVTYMTFRLTSSYNRILIWEWGTRSVENYPVFGIGQGEWERPHFMSSSMDNFWLLTAVRYGLPALIFLLAALFLIGRKLERLELTQDSAAIRKGWAISFAGLAMLGATVHFWGGLYCLVMFVLGSVVWLIDQEHRRSTSHKGIP